MRTLILALFFLAFASALCQESQHQYQQQQYLLLVKQVFENLQQVDLDPTQFVLGFNDGLDLVSNTKLGKCAVTLFPSLLGLEQVLQSIVTLQWNGAFANIPALRTVLDDFQDDCNEPFNAYANFFGPALTAFGNDPFSFIGTVFNNFVQSKFDSILDITNLIVELFQQFDYQAGQTFASLVQIGLKSFIPPPTDSTEILN